MKFKIRKIEPVQINKSPESSTITETVPTRTSRRKSLKLRAITLLSVVLVSLLLLGGLLFTGLFYAAQWFDANKIMFQNPLTVLLRQPMVIQHRLAVTTAPKATYIEVNPMTTPQDITDTIKSGGTFSYAPTESLTPVSKETIRTLLHNKVVQKYGENYWKEIDYIINNESGYNPYIVNKSSGACGLAQALPCTKLPSLDITDQIYWLMNVYIPQHYAGDITAAYQHKLATGWY